MRRRKKMYRPPSNQRWDRIIADIDRSHAAATPAFTSRVQECRDEMKAGLLTNDEMKAKHGGIVFSTAREWMMKLGGPL